ncbi:MAG TPA: thiamine biosynthesis protein ApbE [Cytophagales bacterium]|nr:thiamine biosynthesis protein ApbE [Cytophagales bacterium]
MNNRVKNAIYSVVLVSLVFIVWKYRQSNSIHEIRIEGKTMGTTYHITYFDKEGRNLKPQIDSLLEVFNQSLSTYLKESEVSLFNTGNVVHFRLPFFLPVLEKSEEITTLSEGAFDPTVMPLVNAWGFGPGRKMKIDSVQVDSIMEFVGFDKVQFNRDSIWKEDKRVQLDFSAIAKGYGVDEVANLIRSQGINDWFVEIGGEISAFGKNQKLDKPWEAGVLHPNSTYENQSFKAYVQLQDKAMATSGNYFNYYEENGKKYAHTIDPSSGYTIRHELLSASVFAKDCMTADAWATAFMVMGKKKTIEKLEQLSDVDAFLIYSTDKGIETFVSDGMASAIKINP